jgi:hypothetical protein
MKNSENETSHVLSNVKSCSDRCTMCQTAVKGASKNCNSRITDLRAKFNCNYVPDTCFQKCFPCQTTAAGAHKNLSGFSSEN